MNTQRNRLDHRPGYLPRVFWLATGVFIALANPFARANDATSASNDEIAESVDRSIARLQKAATGTADNRTCFTCHGQAMPVLTMVEARRRGFTIDPKNLNRQLKHTHAHLAKGKKSYAKGKGQGGGVDTAGYALWTLEDGDVGGDHVTDAVVEYLLQKQTKAGFWKCSSDRPPSESSDFTTSYLAIRGLSAFSRAAHQGRVSDAITRAATWLGKADPADTEDLVFGLLCTDYLDVPAGTRDSYIDRLLQSQRSDGGWAQKPEMESDAYATGSVLYALHRAGIADELTSNRGIRFLLDSQQSDGTWQVKTRSRPFQEYFETGFPYGDDQFISTSATAWATLALLLTLPETATEELMQSSDCATKSNTR